MRAPEGVEGRTAHAQLTARKYALAGVYTGSLAATSSSCLQQWHFSESAQSGILFEHVQADISGLFTHSNANTVFKHSQRKHNVQTAHLADAGDARDATLCIPSKALIAGMLFLSIFWAGAMGESQLRKGHTIPNTIYSLLLLGRPSHCWVGVAASQQSRVRERVIETSVCFFVIGLGLSFVLVVHQKTRCSQVKRLRLIRHPLKLLVSSLGFSCKWVGAAEALWLDVHEAPWANRDAFCGRVSGIR